MGLLTAFAFRTSSTSHLGFGLQPSKVASKRYLIGKPASLSRKSIHGHGRKHHAEQCWCHNTALFDPIRYVKGLREISIILHTCLHAIMKLPHHCYESEWKANLAMIFQSPSRLTVPKALMRSTNVMYRSTYCSLHFS